MTSMIQWDELLLLFWFTAVIPEILALRVFIWSFISFWSSIIGCICLAIDSSVSLFLLPEQDLCILRSKKNLKQKCENFFGLVYRFRNISIISWHLVLLVEETRVHGENHWPVASHWQTLSHNIVSSTPRHERWTFFLSEMLKKSTCIVFNVVFCVWICLYLSFISPSRSITYK